MATILIIILGISALVVAVYFFIKYLSATEYNCYQIIPARDGFNYDKAKLLMDRLSELIKPQGFLKGTIKQYKVRLTIDNNHKSGRLRLLIRLDARLSKDLIKQLIRDIDPQMEFSRIKCPPVAPGAKIIFFKLRKHYAFSLGSNDATTDPLISLSRALSRQDPKDQVELDLTLSTNNSLRTRYIRNRIMNGHPPKLYGKNTVQILRQFLWYATLAAISLLRAGRWLIEEVLDNHESSYQMHNTKYKRVNDDLGIEILDKLYGNLWNVRLRTWYSSKEAEKEISVAMSSFTSKTQKLKKSLTTFKPFKSSILSSGELAGLFHIPEELKDQGIFMSNTFKPLAPAPELITPSRNAVEIGENIFAGKRSALILSEDLRERHLFILGATGSGKSTLLCNMIRQDVALEHGLSLIDPHGDLATGIIKGLPKNSQDQVIYFDPSDIDYPIGINLLEISSEPGTKEYRLEVDRIVESIISLFRKVFSEDGESGGHRIEYLIRNCVYTALSLDNCTIFTVLRLLTDSKFRLRAVSKLNNPDLINFWQQELGKAGDYQRIKMSAGVTSKIGRLLYSAPTRRVFGQTKSTINFDDILSSGKILICNFSKGVLGEDASRLFGIAVLTKLQLAALKRSEFSEEKRTPHFLYVDEFQSFATPAVTQMLSESRKYKLYLTLANQSLSQLDNHLSATILANVGNVICFKNPNPREEKELLPLFSPHLSTGDLMHLPAYHYYLQSTCLDNLPAVSAMSLPAVATDNNQSLINRSRKNYALNLRPSLSH